MKKVFIVLLFGFIFFSVQGQENASKQKLTRKEKKELRLKQEEKTKKHINSLINSRQFVLNADFLTFPYPFASSINSRINFIKVDSSIAIFQFGSDYARSLGSNGLGGSTTKGRITKYKVSKSERSGWYDIQIYILAHFGSFRIRMNISPLGVADAEVNFRSSRIGYSGRISEFKENNIFQGVTY